MSSTSSPPVPVAGCLSFSSCVQPATSRALIFSFNSGKETTNPHGNKKELRNDGDEEAFSQGEVFHLGEIGRIRTANIVLKVNINSLHHITWTYKCAKETHDKSLFFFSSLEILYSVHIRYDMALHF